MKKLLKHNLSIFHLYIYVYLYIYIGYCCVRQYVSRRKTKAKHGRSLVHIYSCFEVSCVWVYFCLHTRIRRGYSCDDRRSVDRSTGDAISCLHGQKVSLAFLVRLGSNTHKPTWTRLMHIFRAYWKFNLLFTCAFFESLTFLLWHIKPWMHKNYRVCLFVSLKRSTVTLYPRITCSNKNDAASLSLHMHQTRARTHIHRMAYIVCI